MKEEHLARIGMGHDESHMNESRHTWTRQVPYAAKNGLMKKGHPVQISMSRDESYMNESSNI